MSRKQNGRPVAQSGGRQGGRRTRPNNRAQSGKEAVPPQPSQLRGHLPVPTEVGQFVAREVAERPMSDAARQRLVEGLTLQYYFGGHDIAYRASARGPEVLAVGDEIGPLLRQLGPAERQAVIVAHPEPW